MTSSACDTIKVNAPGAQTMRPWRAGGRQPPGVSAGEELAWRLEPHRLFVFVLFGRMGNSSRRIANPSYHQMKFSSAIVLSAALFHCLLRSGQLVGLNLRLHVEHQFL